MEELLIVLGKQRPNYADRIQIFEHYNIMGQALLQRLKEQVAEPFGKLQKQRQREAVTLWQNPLRVELYVPPAPAVDEMDAALGLPAEQRTAAAYAFVPQRPRHILQQNFMSSYELPDEAPLERPVSLFDNRSKRGSGFPDEGTSDATSPSSMKPPEKRLKPPNQAAAAASAAALGFSSKPQQPKVPHHSINNMEPSAIYLAPEPQELQQEAVLLKASLENDLDHVQKMETTMVNITKLLSQFADLVANQQEDIMQIHDAAEDTKDNIEKGQDKLLDAAEQTQHSNHYMATAITAMGCLLLFVHWIRP